MQASQKVKSRRKEKMYTTVTGVIGKNENKVFPSPSLPNLLLLLLLLLLLFVKVENREDLFILSSLKVISMTFSLNE